MHQAQERQTGIDLLDLTDQKAGSIKLLDTAQPEDPSLDVLVPEDQSLDTTAP